MAKAKTKRVGKVEISVAKDDVPPRKPEVPAGLVDRVFVSLNPVSSSRRTPGLDRLTALLLLSGLLLLVLVVFLRRPFHIDDPLFIWTARHIQTQPANPYGFPVNWYGMTMAISDVAKNPPLASYYIAGAARVLGWSEPALHFVFILVSLAVGIGTYLIAERLCSHPLLATLAGVLTPVFIVSSLTVMSDVLMLAFWIFAVYLWMRGLETVNHAALAGAAVLIAASAITKYFGMALIPLLLVYSLFKKRSAGIWLVYFAIPIAILGWYQWQTRQLYGRGLLFDAAEYATDFKSDFAKFPIAKTYVDLAFAGACVATALLFARQLWSRAALAGGALFALIAAVMFINLPTLGSFTMPAVSSAHFLLAIQLSIWGVAGISLIALAAVDLNERRDADSLFLFLWTFGTFLFAGFINWTTNGRSLLPMTIPVGILIARRLESRARPRGANQVPVTLVPLAAALLLSFAVAWADTAFAETARTGAAKVHESYGKNQTVWFQGHWGFQYYMEQLGAKPIDVKEFRASFGDVVVVPTTNTNIFPMRDNWPVRKVFEVAPTSWLATMNSGLGAGFYADVYGPLPYVIGSVPPEQFRVFEIAK